MIGGYFPAGTSASKAAAAVTAAGTYYTAECSVPAAVVGEQLVAFLAFASENLHTY